MTIDDTADDGQMEVHGIVKWFDPQRGFGFLADDAGGKDVLVHANVLRRFGQGSVAEGARMSVQAATTPRGRQATAILTLTPPADEGRAAIADLDSLTPQERAALPLWPARVKWFDKAKGFGFANLFGHEADVFLHVEVLRASGFADLAAGEAVAMRVFPGPRGLMAVHIAPWDSAVAAQGGTAWQPDPAGAAGDHHHGGGAGTIGPTPGADSPDEMDPGQATDRIAPPVIRVCGS